MKIFIKILIIYLTFPHFLFGWGKTGHRIVGKVSETYLTKNAKTKIKKLMGHHDISRMTNWADEIKSDPAWKKANNWHWCTIPDDEKYISEKHPGRAVEKIQDFIYTLKNKTASKEEKQIALKFLVHIIGDLHQPLHVGNGNDRGGNDVKVQWFNESTNLHSVWDTKLIEFQKLSYTEYTNYLLLSEDRSLIRTWQGTSVLEYIHESKDLRKRCYDFSGEELKWEYFYKNKEILEKRLFQGGVRISGELNRIFK